MQVFFALWYLVVVQFHQLSRISRAWFILEMSILITDTPTVWQYPSMISTLHLTKQIKCKLGTGLCCKTSGQFILASTMRSASNTWGFLQTRPPRWPLARRTANLLPLWVNKPSWKKLAKTSSIRKNQPMGEAVLAVSCELFDCVF